MGRRGILGRQTVFHQPDVYAALADALRLRVWIGVSGLDGRIAQSNEVHTVDGNLMFGNQITLD
jgi:hypothetical protein